MSASVVWPVVAGTYEVGDRQGPVAICVLTSETLTAPLAHLPGVAITGKVYTANLGITRIVINITANPAIRFLLICGKDSPLFHPGQSLAALAERGIDAEHRIVDAIGYDPVLPTLDPDRVDHFRRQVEVVDWTGEEDQATLARGVASLVARNPGRFASADSAHAMPPPAERFTRIRPGGTREPLQYDPKGYFVITLDRADASILLRHYLPDHTPAHEMRGRSAGPMLLGLLREGLVSQLSHAGYLGEELAKAEAALRLEVRYDQDRPLRPRVVAAMAAEPTASDSPTCASPPTDTPGPDAPNPTAPGPDARPMSAAASGPAAPPSMARIQPALTIAQLDATAPGTNVDIALALADQPAPDLLAGSLLEADEAEPFNAYRRTARRLLVRWNPATRIIMGTAADLIPGGLIRARGVLGSYPSSAAQLITAESLVILTRVARIIEG
jgi:tetrahydromethanopterin S-methyltransferase subunit A